MDWLKKLAVSSILVILFGCYVPGTYFSNQDISDGYYYQGKKIHIKVAQVTPNWIAEHGRIPYQYKIGAYDILNIVVWDHPELTTVTTQQASPDQTGILVDQDGYIYFPFAGRVKVDGLTLEQARQLLEKNLSKYIQNPQVTIRVADFRSQTIEVLHDGSAETQPITDKPLSVMNAISASGGVGTDAKTVQIYILREEDPTHLHLFWFNAQRPEQLIAAEHFYLQANDIVYVPSAGIANWNRVISLLMPTVSTPSTITSQTQALE